MRHPSASRSRNVLHLQMYSIRWSATSIPHATHTTQVNIAMCTHTWHFARRHSVFLPTRTQQFQKNGCLHSSNAVGESMHAVRRNHLGVRRNHQPTFHAAAPSIRAFLSPVPLSGLPKSAAALQRLGRVFTRYTYRAGTNAQHEESNPT